MCGCEGGFVCARCDGTWLDDRYEQLPDPRAEDEQARYEAAGRSSNDEKTT